ncbi:MAG: DUF4918 family protein [Saprospiraceae bacterium]|nr:DUF4918 family protein [Saprospiraceae bacterium]
MNLLSDRILNFYSHLHYDGILPDGIKIMNPFVENEDIRDICSSFYKKFYDDNNPRTLILGINPGRLGAGATGIPFTDTKRLNEDCAIPYSGFVSHEPSSVFIYEMIQQFGGPQAFYSMFYINSVCPLGFTFEKESGKSINYNYYDDVLLESAVKDFIIRNIQTQIELTGSNEVCFCLGTGKNYTFLSKLNTIHHFFEKIIPLEHPRFIMQYKSKSKQWYIDDYLRKLTLEK